MGTCLKFILAITMTFEATSNEMYCIITTLKCPIEDRDKLYDCLTKLNGLRKSEVSRFKEEVAQVKVDHEAEVKRVKDQHDAVIRELKQRHKSFSGEVLARTTSLENEANSLRQTVNDQVAKIQQEAAKLQDVGTLVASLQQNVSDLRH